MNNEKHFLPYARQTIDDEDVKAVAKVLRGDFLTTGPAVGAFEKRLSDVCDAKYAVSCSSGTAALHLAMLALGVGAGDSVIVPAITFLATANAARFVGAEVVFADVDPASGLMEARHFEDALSRASESRVKAVIPVHLGGQCADLTAVKEVAVKNGVRIVEDACHALGARYSGDTIGNCRHSDMAVFSFHPVKTIAMGEGGAVMSNDQEIVAKISLMRNHGMSRDKGSFSNGTLAFNEAGKAYPWYYEMADIGYNYRASDIHCALGLSQLGKLNGFVRRRRELAALYDELLSTLSPVVRPVGRNTDCQPAWHLYQVLIEFEETGMTRMELVRGLRKEGIGTQVHYIPVHRQPYYSKRYTGLNLPGSDLFYQRTLSLPLYPGLNDTDIHRIVDALKGLILRST